MNPALFFGLKGIVEDIAKDIKQDKEWKMKRIKEQEELEKSKAIDDDSPYEEIYE